MKHALVLALALPDHQRLSHGLHSRGMVLVQDIVVNLAGNYFDYQAGWDERDPTRFYVPNSKSLATQLAARRRSRSLQRRWAMRRPSRWVVAIRCATRW